MPGIGPIISSAMVAAIGIGDGFAKDRDFAAWLGLVPRVHLEARLTSDKFYFALSGYVNHQARTSSPIRSAETERYHWDRSTMEHNRT